MAKHKHIWNKVCILFKKVLREYLRSKGGFMYVRVILPKDNNIKVLKAKLIARKINQVTIKKVEKDKLLSSVISSIKIT